MLQITHYLNNDYIMCWCINMQNVFFIVLNGFCPPNSQSLVNWFRLTVT